MSKLRHCLIFFLIYQNFFLGGGGVGDRILLILDFNH